MCVSPPYVKTFNSKLIKRFRTWTRSRYVFSNFEIPMFFKCSIVINIRWPFHHFAHGHIRVYGHATVVISNISELHFLLYLKPSKDLENKFYLTIYIYIYIYIYIPYKYFRILSKSTHEINYADRENTYINCLGTYQYNLLENDLFISF